MDKELHTIYVYLENEGVDVWRPVKAEHLGGEVYRISERNQGVAGEHWQYAAGDTVRCESRVLEGGERGFVAVSRT